MIKKIISNIKFIDSTHVETYLNEGYNHFANCDFSGLNLIKTNLSNLVFDHGTSFKKAKLGNLEKSEFYGVSFEHADLSRADISNTSALNCNITGVNMRGIKMSLDCFFFDGVYSTSELDGYKLLYWSSLFHTKIQEKIRENIPERYQSFMSKFFKIGARR